MNVDFGKHSQGECVHGLPPFGAELTEFNAPGSLIDGSDYASPNTDTGPKEKSSVESDKFLRRAVSAFVVGSEGARRRGDERVEQ